MHKSLSQSRKKVAKLGQEMNDLKLLLEAQQGRNAELEKRQRK
jgi:myosin-18